MVGSTKREKQVSKSRIRCNRSGLKKGETTKRKKRITSTLERKKSRVSWFIQETFSEKQTGFRRARLGETRSKAAKDGVKEGKK